MGMGQYRLIRWRIGAILIARVRQGQGSGLKPRLANPLQQVTRVLTANETTIGPAILKSLGQGQAAHDMARAHLEGSIGAEKNVHY
jgi:hypothetical protein